MELNARVSELHFVIGDGGFGGEMVGLGGVQCFADVGIVESGQQLAFVDMRALVEKDASDAAGDFGGDGGTATGRDVAAGVEQRFAAAGVCGFLHHGDFHYRLPVPKDEDSAGYTAQNDEQPEEDREALSPTGARALAVVNAQGTEVVYRCGCVRWSSHA